MALLDAQLGSLLIGSYFNLLFLGVEIYLFFQYRLSKERLRDSRLLQYIVSIAIVNDFFGSALECLAMYRVLIIAYGNPSKIQSMSNWPIGAYFISSSLSIVLGQGWLIWRYFQISKRRWPALILATAVLCPFAVEIAAGIYAMQPSRAKNLRRRVNPVAILGFAAVATVDLGIAGALLWELWRVQPVFRSTRFVIRKITINIIQTGSATFLVALAVGVLYFVNPESSVSRAVFFCHGRVYTCTVLFTLNYRAKLRDGAAAQVYLSTGALQISSAPPLVSTASTGDISKEPASPDIFNNNQLAHASIPEPLKSTS
ncbi:hypothetical protein HGRIS_000166 [Hohenbuehelia grisea]|uniref:DUF6534 domain-containing protein n=1 Tax=Hohenbuehelia grisea TaxID=104357 RepID=A0ABR3JQE8_9AGAR